ncbi:DUF924 family protein [Zavarzinia compransoris]|uniref:DUF924 family protein n=1 Tax=Zavarzinia marina TaxID=2911065 RepID=UPI001F45A8D0|nr:DUF924 family protein [Zavarzinia marina]MCF4165829.1 DUF924 family protein [Zavarzinia marina]
MLKAVPLQPVSDAEAIIAFWRAAGPDKWFSKDEAFDTDFRDRFLDRHLAAAARRLDSWAMTPDGALALIILLDQFPRNAFRDTAHMFATDGLARHFARRALALGHDKVVAPELRGFFYLPFEHSEDLADQDLSVELMRPLGREVETYAEIHRDIIARFGRFPHRNPALGRETTAAEREFLAKGGFSG